MKYLLIILLLTGCGVEPEPDEFAGYKWDGEYSHISELGFFIHSDEPIDYTYVSKVLDSIWVKTQSCINIYIDPDRPLVINFSSSVPTGFIHINPSYVYLTINPIDLVSDFMPITKHEFIHYLLHLNTSDLDNKHNSIYFDLCT